MLKPLTCPDCGAPLEVEPACVIDEDPDFREGYFRGDYDVDCAECHGARVVPAVDRENNRADVVAKVDAADEARWNAARGELYERRMGY